MAALSRQARRLLLAALLALASPAAVAAGERELVRVAPGVFALMGHGGVPEPGNAGRTANAGFIVGPRGVVVIDTGISYRDGKTIIAAVRRVSSRPIRLAILTHPDQEVIFGAAAFEEQRIPVLAHPAATALIAARCARCLQNLATVLGDEAMRGTTIPAPTAVSARTVLEATGRGIRILAYEHASAPGALAVFDSATSVLFTGSLVLNRRIPDLRDADLYGWHEALRRLGATRCAHLVPSYGRIATCAAVAPFLRYLDAVEAKVATQFEGGVGLADLHAHVALPGYSAWDQYEPLHAQNANRIYLRLEEALLKSEPRTPRPVRGMPTSGARP